LPDVRGFLFGGAGGGSATADLGLLLLRLMAGFGLITHGIGKIPPSAPFVAAVHRLGFPLPTAFAWMSGGAEFLGGVLLFVGLLVRPASLLLLINMSVAAFLQLRHASFSSRELALLYLAIAALYFCTGSGRYGVDTLLGRKKRR
jgi:putative oxidoreductase